MVTFGEMKGHRRFIVVHSNQQKAPAVNWKHPLGFKVESNKGNPEHKCTSSTPNTWLTFEQAMNCALNYHGSTGKAECTVAYVYSKHHSGDNETSLCFLDIDLKTEDEEEKEKYGNAILEFIDKLEEVSQQRVYASYSASGTGVHIVFDIPLEDIEVYKTGKIEFKSDRPEVFKIEMWPTTCGNGRYQCIPREQNWLTNEPEEEDEIPSILFDDIRVAAAHIGLLYETKEEPSSPAAAKVSKSQKKEIWDFQNTPPEILRQKCDKMKWETQVRDGEDDGFRIRPNGQICECVSSGQSEIFAIRVMGNRGDYCAYCHQCNQAVTYKLAVALGYDKPDTKFVVENVQKKYELPEIFKIDEKRNQSELDAKLVLHYKKSEIEKSPDNFFAFPNKQTGMWTHISKSEKIYEWAIATVMRLVKSAREMAIEELEDIFVCSEVDIDQEAKEIYLDEYKKQFKGGIDRDKKSASAVVVAIWESDELTKTEFKDYNKRGWDRSIIPFNNGTALDLRNRELITDIEKLIEYRWLEGNGFNCPPVPFPPRRPEFKYAQQIIEHYGIGLFVIIAMALQGKKKVVFSYTAPESNKGKTFFRKSLAKAFPGFFSIDSNADNNLDVNFDQDILPNTDTLVKISDESGKDRSGNIEQIKRAMNKHIFKATDEEGGVVIKGKNRQEANLMANEVYFGQRFPIFDGSEPGIENRFMYSHIDESKGVLEEEFALQLIETEGYIVWLREYIIWLAWEGDTESREIMARAKIELQRNAEKIVLYNSNPLLRILKDYLLYDKDETDKSKFVMPIEVEAMVRTVAEINDIEVSELSSGKPRMGKYIASAFNIPSEVKATQCKVNKLNSRRYLNFKCSDNWCEAGKDTEFTAVYNRIYNELEKEKKK